MPLKIVDIKITMYPDIPFVIRITFPVIVYCAIILWMIKIETVGNERTLFYKKEKIGKLYFRQ